MKRQTTIIFGIIVATMTSCVYSLFPIYTEDTLIFKEELLGKWIIDDDGSYMLFERMGETKAEKESKNEDYKYSIRINEGFTMSSDEPIFIEKNGRKIYDEDSIRMFINKKLQEDSSIATNPPAKPNVKQVVKDQIKKDELSPRDIEYKGSVTTYEEKSYRLTISDAKNGPESYIAHLVSIGDDLFMDLYPIKEFDSKNISDNFFPVHTFFKIAVTKDQFTMTHFDLEKLNKLFESNLIRLRHENVDGTVLITAQPKELQKFIDKYSDDESVFDFTETYKKAS